jgi:pantoate--beta-alanine ligase
MGALHAGHLALVDAARRRAATVVMSVFVNPLQFGPAEDFARYPRDAEGDAAKARERGVDVLFTPDPAEVYPREPRARVVPGAMADRWEGAVRPGHFAGVLTVVAKLFHLVAPDVAVFGQKDAQQAALVRAMVADLDFPVDVVVAPTVRESDGLALSSPQRVPECGRARARAVHSAGARGGRDALRGRRAARRCAARRGDGGSSPPSPGSWRIRRPCRPAHPRAGRRGGPGHAAHGSRARGPHAPARQRGARRPALRDGARVSAPSAPELPPWAVVTDAAAPTSRA